jgi:hypothetical protein
MRRTVSHAQFPPVANLTLAHVRHLESDSYDSRKQESQIPSTHVCAFVSPSGRATGQVPYQDFTCPVTALTRHLQLACENIILLEHRNFSRCRGRFRVARVTAMSWKRLLRIGWLLVSNGSIFFFAVRLLMAFGAATASEARIDRLLGAVLCSWCLLGFAAELIRHRWARRINIALPVSIATFMASTVLWLPVVTKDGDRFEAATGFLLFASAPICLAILNYLAYRLTRGIDPNPRPLTSGS